MSLDENAVARSMLLRSKCSILREAHFLTCFDKTKNEQATAFPLFSPWTLFTTRRSGQMKPKILYLSSTQLVTAHIKSH